MRVLVVSPHFPPTNAPDAQRVRMVLPYLQDFGVEAEVLCVDPANVAAPIDDWLLHSVPSDVPIHRAHAWSLKFGVIPGFGTLSNRAMFGLRRVGNRVLKQKRFDLVYFSTTQFKVHLLGPYWKRRFGVPFCLDYQDPWVNDYYHLHPQIRPPGGRLKFGLNYKLSARAEPKVLRECSGVTSVSPAYIRQIKSRYPFMADHFPVRVLPFPGDKSDLDLVRKSTVIQQSFFSPKEGIFNWVYVGRGGADMQPAFRGLLEALKLQRMITPELVNRIRIYLVGTSYARTNPLKSLEPLAVEYGLGDIVHESPPRIPYSEMLQCLLDADALLVLGSDDTAYTPSKIYPYLLSGKPLLCIMHVDSPVMKMLHEVGGGISVGFQTGETPIELGEKIRDACFPDNKHFESVPLVQQTFEPYTARSQARDLADFWCQLVVRNSHKKLQST